MATLTPTLTLKSTDITSDELNFTVTKGLTISAGKKVITNGRIPTDNTGVTFLSSSDYGKSYVYLRNTDDTIVITIKHGSTTFATLAAEEFAFFPWDGAGNLVATSASGTPVLEYAVIEA
jgi:hypothetical protein|tara:strand:- start:918 stop:1277 length:360 start_codon:yes stop_codon:yes gene_type:complete